MKQKPLPEIKFLGDEQSLLKIEKFPEVAKDLGRFIQRVNKSLAKVAETHGVQLKVEMMFDLKPKAKEA